MTIENVIQSLTFNSYAHNRMRSPEISPRSWTKIYGVSQVALMEFALQRQLKKAKKTLR